MVLLLCCHDKVFMVLLASAGDAATSICQLQLVANSWSDFIYLLGVVAV